MDSVQVSLEITEKKGKICNLHLKSLQKEKNYFKHAS